MFRLAALAADVHVSTPTAAANLLNQSWEDASFRVVRDADRMSAVYRNMIARAERALDFSYYVECVQAMRSAVLRRDGILRQKDRSFRSMAFFVLRAMRLETVGPCDRRERSRAESAAWLRNRPPAW